MSTKVAVALSGGVDSAAAARLLIKKGCKVKGFFLKLFPDADPSNARAVADALGIEFEAVDLTREFNKLVVEPFVESYLAGKTPNPCALCNPLMKFGKLLDIAKAQGFWKLATGHYAKIVEGNNGGFHLYRADHPDKDQSYFLFGIPKDRLADILLPLGNISKEEAKRLVVDERIPASRTESQDVCFLTGGDYREFLERRIDDPPKAGQIVDLHGRVRGIHRGYHRYTVGQRHGLGIRSRRPFFVVEIDPTGNRVIIGRERDLYRKKIVVGSLNMIEDTSDRFSALVQTRARLKPERANITIESNRAIVDFEKAVRAPTPGQAAVFYVGNMVLGGGWIEEVL